MDLTRLRELASGHVEWFAMGTDEKSYFISFSTEWNAVRWMDDQKKRMPEWIEREGIHLVEQRVFSELQELANIAATEIETLREDAARYRWLIESEDNADELHAALMNHGGDKKGIDAQIDEEMELVPYPLLMARAKAALDGGGA